VTDVFNDLGSSVIKNKDLINFFENNEVVQLAFKAGGWIAGGFPREIFKIEDPLGTLADDKLNFDKFKETYFSRGGDIDFFFKDEQSVIALREQQPINLSVYGGAHNFALTAINYESYAKNNRDLYLSVIVQLVNKFFYDSVEETFRGFDFYNSCYAIEKVEGRYILTYLKKAAQIDQLGILKINHVNSPYTIQRIGKYMRQKGLHKIEDDCIQKVTDLVYKLGCESFDSKYKYEQFKRQIFVHLKFAFEKLPLDPGHALIFLGKFKVVDRDSPEPDDSYGPVITVDWATKVVQNCVSTS